MTVRIIAAWQLRFDHRLCHLLPLPGRPYLQPGTAERCLLLLRELLAASQLLSEEQSGPERQQPSVLNFLATVIGCNADELASYAGMAAAPLWRQQQQQQAGEEQERQQDATAQLALTCVCDGLQLLIQLNHGAAGERLAACCLDALQGFAASAQAAAGQQPVTSTADGSAWQREAAPLQPLANCCSALAAAAAAGLLSAAEQHSCSEAAVAALNSVLSLQAAAAEAAAASGTSKHASGLAAYCHRLCWKAVHGLLLLLQQLQPAGDLVGSQQQQQSEEQQAAVLAAALNGLQQASHAPALAADYRGLLQQLRCCRLLLPAALQQQRLAQLVLAQRQEAATAGQASTDLGVALAAWVCSAAWQGYEAAAAAAKRRRAGLTAAVVSTCLHPALFSTAASDGSGPAGAATAAAALHGPSGPIQQLLGRLLRQGVKSWRTMGIMSLQARLQPAARACGASGLAGKAGVTSPKCDAFHSLLTPLANLFPPGVSCVACWRATPSWPSTTAPRCRPCCCGVQPTTPARAAWCVPASAELFNACMPCCWALGCRVALKQGSYLPGGALQLAVAGLTLAGCPSCAPPQGDPVDADAAAELASLMAPGDAKLSAAFASSPLAPRVAALCLLHSWVQQAQQAQQAGAHEAAAGQQAAAAAGEAGRQLWRQLLDLALHDAELSATRYSALSIVHRKKVSGRVGKCKPAQLHMFRVQACAASHFLGASLHSAQQPLNSLYHCCHALSAGAAVAGALRAQPTGARLRSRVR